MAKAQKWHEKLFGKMYLLNDPQNGEVVVRVSSKIPEYKTVIGAPKEPGIHISVRRTDGRGTPIGKDGKGKGIVPGYSLSETLGVARLLEEKVNGKTRRQSLLEALREAQEWWKEQPNESTPKESSLEQARGSNTVQSGPTESDIQDMIAKAVAAALAAQGGQQQDAPSETENEVQEIGS